MAILEAERQEARQFNWVGFDPPPGVKNSSAYNVWLLFRAYMGIDNEYVDIPHNLSMAEPNATVPVGERACEPIVGLAVIQLSVGKEEELLTLYETVGNTIGARVVREPGYESLVVFCNERTGMLGIRPLTAEISGRIGEGTLPVQKVLPGMTEAEWNPTARARQHEAKITHQGPVMVFDAEGRVTGWPSNYQDLVEKVKKGSLQVLLPNRPTDMQVVYQARGAVPGYRIPKTGGFALRWEGNGKTDGVLGDDQPLVTVALLNGDLSSALMSGDEVGSGLVW